MLTKIRFSLVLIAVTILFGCSSRDETDEVEIIEVPGLQSQFSVEPSAVLVTSEATGDTSTDPNAAGPIGGPPGAGGMGGPPPEETVTDIEPSLVEVYKTVDSVELSAHIFQPEEHSANSSAPALIFFHGGGFRRGSPTQGYAIAERFLPSGVVVVSPQYRLLNNNADGLDQIVADAKSVVRWVRANADRLGVNPDQIVASGHSAGGYLAMTTGVVAGLDETGEDPTVSSVPNALVLWSTGETRQDDPENSMIPEGRTMAEFSAPQELPSDLPPALFIHGDQDPIASPEAAVAFETRYGESGNQSSFQMFEGVDHFFAGEGQRDQVYDLIGDFMISLGYVEAQ